jgi:hypothetical protein
VKSHIKKKILFVAYLIMELKVIDKGTMWIVCIHLEVLISCARLLPAEVNSSGTLTLMPFFTSVHDSSYKFMIVACS